MSTRADEEITPEQVAAAEAAEAARAEAEADGEVDPAKLKAIAEAAHREALEAAGSNGGGKSIAQLAAEGADEPAEPPLEGDEVGQIALKVSDKRKVPVAYDVALTGMTRDLAGAIDIDQRHVFIVECEIISEKDIHRREGGKRVERTHRYTASPLRLARAGTEYASRILQGD